MSPEKSCPIVNRIDVWSCCAMLVFALGAAPPLPARADRDGSDRDDDHRASETTTISVPLSGTGVEAKQGSSTAALTPDKGASKPASGDAAKANESLKPDGKQ
jgi:hypothetical protein